MIRVVFIVSRLSKGGPINQLYYLCKYLDKERIDFTIVTTSPRTTSNTYHEEIRALGIEIIELDYGKVESIFKCVNIIQKIVDQKSIDIIQSFGFRSDFISSRIKRVVKITTVRNRPLFNYRIIYGYVTGTIACSLHMRFVKQFDTVIACSHTVSADLKRFEVKSQVITNALDIAIIPDEVKLKSKESLRKVFNIPQKANIFLTISSNLPGKNIPFVIDSFLNTQHLHGDTLLVAGFVDEHVLNRHKNTSNIRFIGRVPNIFAYYKVSDFFISASLSEGMPNGVLEAMAMGLPVILSDIEAHKEIAESVDYPIGAIFINNDIQDFATKTIGLKRADYKTFSMNCISCVQNRFDASLMSRSYQNLYHDLMKKF